MNINQLVISHSHWSPAPPSDRHCSVRSESAQVTGRTFVTFFVSSQEAIRSISIPAIFVLTRQCDPMFHVCIIGCTAEGSVSLETLPGKGR